MSFFGSTPSTGFSFNQTQPLGFGTAIPTTTAQSTGFTFGTTPGSALTFGNPSSTGGFSFGATTSNPSGGGFGFSTQSHAPTFGDNAAAQSSSTTPATGSIFGTSGVFGGVQQQTPTGFAFGSTNTPATAAAAVAATTTTNTSMFSTPNFGTTFGQATTTTSQTVPAFSTITPSSSTFGFGFPNTITATTTSSSVAVPSTVSMFNFSSAPAPITAVPTVQSFGLQFQPNTQPIIAPNTTTTTTTAIESGFNFGPATNTTNNMLSSNLSTPATTQQTFSFTALSNPNAVTTATLTFGSLQTTTNAPSSGATTTPSLLGVFGQGGIFAQSTGTLATPAVSTSTFKSMQTPTTAAATGFQLEGHVLAPSTSVPAATSTNTFSGFGISKSVATTTSSTSTSSTASFSTFNLPISTTSATTSAFSFGVATAKSTASNLFGTTATTAVATSGSLPVLTATTAPSTSTATITTTASSLFSIGGVSLSSTAPTLTVTTATTITTASSGGAVMNFRQLEEAINKWTQELEEQEKIYLNQATQVNAWDRLLIKNGEKITQLNDALEKVKVDQQRLDHEIDFILAQQRELEELLLPLELSLEQTSSATIQQHADLEREHTYELAENIDVQLKRMAEDLKGIIDHVNSSNNTQDNTDPVYQVGKILNAHMDSLQWIEQNITLVQRKLEEVSQLYEVRRKDQERRFRLAYD